LNHFFFLLFFLTLLKNGFKLSHFNSYKRDGKKLDNKINRGETSDEREMRDTYGRMEPAVLDRKGPVW
jgi:hypothetical protein